MDVDDTVTPYYVRFQVEDRTGVIADITSILARLNIGISGTSTSFDHETIDGRTWNNLVFILHACPWEQLQNALAGIILLPNVGTSPSVLRIEQFDSNSTPTI
jgi:homoserine dehydrogenase